MLSILTQYLLQYRKLVVPHVGTFELVQHAPQFNVVDKLIDPPVYALQWNENTNLPEHQLRYLSEHQQVKSQELDAFGARWIRQIRLAPFTWNGLAVLEQKGNAIAVSDQLLQVPGLSPVKAHKVLREKANHNVLVGDRQMTSRQIESEKGKRRLGWSPFVIAGWVMFVLALAIIIYFLTNAGWNPLGSGLRMKALAPWQW